MHHKYAKFVHHILHLLEAVISTLTLIVLIGMLALEIYQMFTSPEYFSSLDSFLNNILTIVVGLEFVRMLVDMTPANTLEVLIVATRLRISWFVGMNERGQVGVYLMNGRPNGMPDSWA